MKEVQELCQEAIACGASGDSDRSSSKTLWKFFADQTYSKQMYMLQLLYTLVMPVARQNPHEQAATLQFQHDFITAGGIELTNELISCGALFPGCDSDTKKLVFRVDIYQSHVSSFFYCE